MSSIKNAIQQSVDYAIAHGLVYHQTEDTTLNGRHVQLQGKMLFKPMERSFHLLGLIWL